MTIRQKLFIGGVLFVAAWITGVGALALSIKQGSRDHIEVIGELSRTGEADECTLARMNALFEVGLRKMHYTWVEVRGGSNGKPFIIVGHTRGHIPKDYIGNAME